MSEPEPEAVTFPNYRDHVIAVSIPRGVFQVWNPKGERVAQTFESMQLAKGWIDDQLKAEHALGRNSQPVFWAYLVHDLGASVAIDLVKVKGYHGNTGALKLENVQGTGLTESAYRIRFLHPDLVTPEVVDQIREIQERTTTLDTLMRNLKGSQAWHNSVTVHGSPLGTNRPDPVRLLEANADLARKMTEKGFRPLSA